jgi:hypothetical protein
MTELPPWTGMRVAALGGAAIGLERQSGADQRSWVCSAG